MPNALSILSGFASTFSNRLLRSYRTGAVRRTVAAAGKSMLIGMIQMGICMGIQPFLAYNYGAKDIARWNHTKSINRLIGVGAVTGGFCYFVEARLSVCLSKKVQLPLWAKWCSGNSQPCYRAVLSDTNFVQASDGGSGNCDVSTPAGEFFWFRLQALSVSRVDRIFQVLRWHIRQQIYCLASAYCFCLSISYVG